MTLAMIAVTFLVCLGALPLWPYSRAWGYAPAAGVGLLCALLFTLRLFSIL